jgi:xylose isomerase
MDAFARGLKIAAAMLKDKALLKFITARYKGWDSALGSKIEKGKMGFASLEQYALANGEPKVQSGRQELIENVLNEYIK